MALQSLTVAGCGNKEANPSEITYNLTMVVEGNGTTSPAVGDHTYFDGRVVNITATPDTGWQFDSWTGNVDTIDDVDAASTTITMDDDYSITANFMELAEYTLTIDVDGEGITNPAVRDHTYPEGTVVTIIAKPDTGWQFDSWTGDVDTVDDVDAASTTITMDDDYSISANFSQPV